MQMQKKRIIIDSEQMIREHIIMQRFIGMHSKSVINQGFYVLWKLLQHKNISSCQIKLSIKIIVYNIF